MVARRKPGWIGVDLDGTLAHYEGWKGVTEIGAPIPAMVKRVRDWLDDGTEVRVFTARVSTGRGQDPITARAKIEEWCKTHIGVALPVTNIKDFNMVQLWDDRAVQVVPNTGARADGGV
jgi:hypothetical protein